MANKPLVSLTFPDLSDTYTIPQDATDVGAISAPASPTVGDFLVYTNNGWDAMTLSVWQGGSY